MRIPSVHRAVLVLALCVPLQASAYREVAVDGGGTVSGTVKLTKTPPKKAELKVTKDHGACGHGVPDETYLIGAGNGLANAVVVIEGVQAGKKSANTPVEIDNVKCRFTPHVQAFTIDTPLVIKNSDGVLHTTHVYDQEGSIMNIALPTKGEKVTKKLEDPGTYHFKCDAGHTWMMAWAVVTDHPYFAVTDKDGKFSLTDVPPGTYTMKVWHEAAGEKSMKVTVTKGGTVTADVSY